jgi:predicted RNase H-like HicB family nuclease
VNELTGNPKFHLETIRLNFEALAEGGFVATSPDVPGLVAEGATIAEATEIAHGLACVIAESRREHGDAAFSAGFAAETGPGKAGGIDGMGQRR